jgi:hypothetical protein
MKKANILNQLKEKEKIQGDILF